MCNPWQINLEKLIMINLFMDVDLVRDLTKYYCPLEKVIGKRDKSNLVKIDRVSFMESFKITGAPYIDINLEEEIRKYNLHKTMLKRNSIPRYMPRLGRRIALITNDVKPPFELDTFQNNMRYIVYGIDKVIGMDCDKSVT